MGFKKVILKKGGVPMPTGIEVTKYAMDEFEDIQRYMTFAKEENAEKTYAELKKRYISLKALLNVSGVNLSEIDYIKA